MVRASRAQSSLHVGRARARAGQERGGRRAGAGRWGGCAARLGSPAREPEARPHPCGLDRDTLGLPEGGGPAAGGRVSAPATRRTSSWAGAPFQVPVPGGATAGSLKALGFWPEGLGQPPQLLFSASGGEHRSQPASVPPLCGATGRREGLPGPGRQRSRGLRAGRGRLRRGNPAEGKRPQEGLDPGGCRASEATPGNWGVGRRGCGIKKALGYGADREGVPKRGRGAEVGIWTPGFYDRGSVTLGKSHTTLSVTFLVCKSGRGRGCRIETWQLLVCPRASQSSGKA